MFDEKASFIRSSQNTTSDEWTGPHRIVLGIDIGTTQSAVAYAHLFPGGPQNAQRVARWPGQESQKAETKIPSVIYYDDNRKPRSFGAEARLAQTVTEAEDNHWTLVQFFKLNLHPETMCAKHNIKISSLPPNLSIEQVYADFLGYLLRHTESFFVEKNIDGLSIWSELRSSMEFVIAHPNGWDLREQSLLRKAAVKAGLIGSQRQAEDRISFVTEAEASVHFVLFSSDGHWQKKFQAGTDFIVCDAGGSTVDTTFYTVEKIVPSLQLKEKKASACVQAGAIFIDDRARQHFRTALYDGGFRSEELDEYTTEATETFENDTKKSFDDPTRNTVMKVGPHGFSSEALNVKKGRMTISGTQIELFFTPFVAEILTSIKKQMEGYHPKYLLIVGGFGDSPYLRRRIQQGLGSAVQVILANDSTAKAVSDGAVLWFIKQSVIARATRFWFGTTVGRDATQEEADRLGRKLQRRNYGDRIFGYWCPVVAKGVVVPRAEEKSVVFIRSWDGLSKPTLSYYTVDLYATDSDEVPLWVNEANGHLFPGIKRVCTVSADLSPLESTLKMKKAVRGPYWEVQARIVIRFGLTALKAFLVWGENGVERRGPATILPPNFT